MIDSKRSPQGRGKFYALVLSAFAVRLFFMPLTLHGDLLFINQFPYYLSYKGIWDIYGYLGDHYLKQGFAYYPPLVYYVTGFSLFIFKTINPGFDYFMQQANMVVEHHRDLSALLTDFPQTQIFRYIFFMKLPYLLVELGIVGILWRSFDERRRRQAVLSWLWNPVVIFSTYIFGQYRIFSCFFMFLSIYLLSRERRHLGLLFYGVVCLMENYALFFMPFILIIFCDRILDRTKSFLCILIPMLCVLIPLGISSRGLVFSSYFSPILLKGASQARIFNHYPREVNLICQTLFISSYLILIGYLLSRRRKPTTIQQNVSLYTAAYYSGLLILFATHVTSIHYWMWAMPFAIFIQEDKEPWNSLIMGVILSSLFLFNLDNRSLNMALFQPLNPEYFNSMPSLHEIMSGILPWGKVVACSRLLFSILCIFFSWRIFSKMIVRQNGAVK